MQAPLPPIQKNGQLNDILALIDSRMDFLHCHIEFIKDFENGIVSEDDAREYAADIFQHRFKSASVLKEFVQDLLNKVFQPNLKTYHKFKVIINQNPNELAMCMLKLAVEFQLEIGNQRNNEITKATKKKPLKHSMKVNQEYDDLYTYKTILKMLEPLLPETWKMLSKIAQIRPIQKSKSAKHLAPEAPIVRLDFFWEVAKVEIEKTLVQSTTAVSKLTQEETNASLGAASLELLTAVEIFNEIQAQHDSNTPANYTNKFSKYLKDNCALFLKFMNLYLKFQKFSEEAFVLVDAKNYKQKLFQLYQRTSENAAIELKSLLKEQMAMTVLIEDIENDLNPSEKEKLIKIKNSLATLVETINALQAQWPNKIPEDVTRTEQIDEKSKLFRKEIDLIKNNLGECNESILIMLNGIKTEQERQKAEEERKRNEVAQKSYAEKMSFITAKTSACEAYKLDVQKARAAKDATRKPAAIISAPTSEITTYKNIEMEARLSELSDRHLSLILSILKLEKGYTYSQVYHLIENQLGGKILEVGNGSSHKRIVLSKYTIDIISYKEEEPALSKVSTVAVDGFFKPHGNAHNSGAIINFNLRLVRNVFIKAGITLPVIQALYDKKCKLPEAPSAGM